MIRAILLLSLLLCLPIHAQVELARSKAVEFVKSFYAWYAPFSQTDHIGPSFETAIKRYPSIFSAELHRALLSDASAQSKVSGYIVGIDFDPFLNSQDPAGEYEIDGVTEQLKRYSFQLHAVIQGRKQQKSAVIAEVEQQSGKWVFVNFRYPEGTDLLSILTNSRESRAKKHGR